MSGKEYDKGKPMIDETELQVDYVARRERENEINKAIMPDAGKVPLDAPQAWGRGIVTEFKSCVIDWWFAEMKNFNQKTIAVSMLMFISVVAPTLTFGAVYGSVTNNQIGAIETILATSWVGCTYALIGGMPVAIIGSTGPILIMTTALRSMAETMDIPFRAFYAWVSIWIMVYATVSGFFDLTRFVRLATRFTDDAFALLIVSIFIMNAIGDPFSNVGLLRLFDPKHPSHEALAEDDPDYSFLTTALLSLILGLGTTWLIFFFRGFKFSSFFCNQTTRTSLFDFAVTLGVVVMTLIYQLCFSNVTVDGLKVPSTFQPSFQCCDDSCSTFWPDDCEEQAESIGTRPWLADFGDLNGKAWVPFMAAGPALLAFLLVFLDNGITWHLINHPSNKLQHGVAYNWDLVLNGAMNCINGCLGLPWLVATTVPCIIHVGALAEKDKDGKVISVQETRLTGLFAHMLLGLVMLFLDVLKLLPLPVLYGVFLFMGLSSLVGMQMWNRFLLFFMQPSQYPETPYTKYMQKARVHKYTLMQMVCFGLIFFVQNYGPIRIGFPLMTFLCIPARIFFLPRFFEGWELLLLDGDDDDIDEWIELKELRSKRVMLEEGVTYEDSSELPMHVVDYDNMGGVEVDC